MDARARYNIDTTLFRLYVSFRDDCATFTPITRSKREIREIPLVFKARGLGVSSRVYGLENALILIFFALILIISP